MNFVNNITHSTIWFLSWFQQLARMMKLCTIPVVLTLTFLWPFLQCQKSTMNRGSLCGQHNSFKHLPLILVQKTYFFTLELSLILKLYKILRFCTMDARLSAGGFYSRVTIYIIHIILTQAAMYVAGVGAMKLAYVNPCVGPSRFTGTWPAYQRTVGPLFCYLVSSNSMVNGVVPLMFYIYTSWCSRIEVTNNFVFPWRLIVKVYTLWPAWRGNCWTTVLPHIWHPATLG